MPLFFHAAGSYSRLGFTACVSCNAGSFAASNMSACSGCAPGQFSAPNSVWHCFIMLLLLNCHIPNSWKETPNILSVCVCRLIWIFVQVKCDACLIGHFSNVSLATACSNCLPPMYSDVALGATTCVLCGAGSESVQRGNNVVDGFKCTLCAPGSYRYMY